MKFRLTQKAVGHAGPTGLTTFNVSDEKGVVRGTVSVPSSEAEDLVKCWKGEFRPAAKTDNKAKLMAALKAGPKLSKQALLRGS
jgi:hypothetical protein